MIRIVVPYTKEVLDSVVYEYQAVYWPFQFVFLSLALLALYLIWKNDIKNNKFIIVILAAFWFWLGAIYEINYYTTINWFGLYIGAAFILQGLLFLWFGLVKKSVVFVKSRSSVIAALLLVLGYPLLQLLSSSHHFEISMIGMLPNITAAFSWILLFMTTQKRVKTLFVIPLAWSAFSLYWSYLLAFNVLEVSNSFVG